MIELPRDWALTDAAPAWACTACGVASARVVIPQGKVSAAGFGETLLKMYEGVLQQEMRFVAQAFCTWCKSGTVIAGDIAHEHFEDGDPAIVVLIPRYVAPAPIVVERAAELPEEMEVHLRRIEHLYWVDDSSCSNAIRTLVEAFLDHHDVPRLGAKGGSMTTHARILEYARVGPKEAELALHLEAIKWIGNSGSHSATAACRHVVDDALEQVELVLREAFDQTKTRLKLKAAEVNAKHRRPKQV